MLVYEVGIALWSVFEVDPAQSTHSGKMGLKVALSDLNA